MRSRTFRTFCILRWMSPSSIFHGFNINTGRIEYSLSTYLKLVVYVLHKSTYVICWTMYVETVGTYIMYDQVLKSKDLLNPFLWWKEGGEWWEKQSALTYT
uniref:Uncharacterized protein n=1 Tax=Cacopsylla melanoneura TaxID=428564 RepID=A0A8D9A8U7_9HEMI